MTNVSIIVPTRDRRARIGRALESIFAQTYRDYEVLVVDDGSTDGTDRELAKLGDRIRVLRTGGLGAGGARNAGIAEARGNLIAFLDSDDAWLPAKLAKQVAFLHDNPTCVLCYTDFQYESARESHLRKLRHRPGPDAFTALLAANFIGTSTVVLRRSILATTGPFDPRLVVGEDLDLWLRIARAGKLGVIDEILVRYTQDADSLTRSQPAIRHLIAAWGTISHRWRADVTARRHVDAHLGELHWDLGYQEYLAGNFSEARAAYLRSARIAKYTLPALARAAFLCLPAGFVRARRSRR